MKPRRDSLPSALFRNPAGDLGSTGNRFFMALAFSVLRFYQGATVPPTWMVSWKLLQVAGAPVARYTCT